MRLTDSQAQAVEWRKQDACVVAGPGSGKTTVLVERYRTLVTAHGFAPHEILAITFTEKAAANMLRKIRDEFAADPFLAVDIEKAWISTIHGFCGRLLRENAVAAEVDPRFAILDATEADDLQIACASEALDQLTRGRREAILELISAIARPESLARNMVRAYEAIRSSGMALDEVRGMPGFAQPFDPGVIRREVAELTNWTGETPTQRTQRTLIRQWAQTLTGDETFEAFAAGLKVFDLRRVPKERKAEIEAFRERLAASFADARTARYRELIFDAFVLFEELYESRKLELAALDFTDLERQAIRLLETHAPVRERVRRQFRQVMLDEFQDINRQQAALIALVRGDEVFFAVGDINQSIYGFRHARPEIFEEYERSVRETNKHIGELFDNFRSRPHILRAVEEATNTLDGIVARDLKAGASFADRDESPVEAWRVTADSDDPSGLEARWIAWRIAQLHGTLRISCREARPAEFRDFAVLCRNSDSMGPILEAFEAARIPYVCGRRESYLVSREGRDLIAILRAIINPGDSIALATALRSPMAGVSDEGLLRLRMMAGSITGGLNRVRHDRQPPEGCPEPDAGRLVRFAALLGRWREQEPVTPIEVLISRIAGDCGVETGETVEAFARLARTRAAGKSLPAFLHLVDSLQRNRSGDSDVADEDLGDVVKVMTAHSAKGLEFPVVFLAAMGKGVRHETDSVTFTPDRGLGLEWRGNVNDSWQTANEALIRDREQKETNRLLYVAMTRAQEHLVLSYTKKSSSAWTKVVDAMPQLRELTTEPPQIAVEVMDHDDAAHLLEPLSGISPREASITATSVALFADCPRRYYLERYLGWPGIHNYTGGESDADHETGQDPGSAAQTGTLVHSLLAGKPGDYGEEVRALAAVFERSETAERVAHASRSSREWDFIVEAGGMLIEGVIDLWFEDEGGVTIVDYKTDSRVEPARHAPQLALYALALERATGRRPNQLLLHYLRHDQVVEVQPPDALAIVSELRDAQENLRFPAQPADRCHSCPFFRNGCLPY